MAWEIFNIIWGFAKKVIIKSQRPFMYGSNFYASDVTYQAINRNEKWLSSLDTKSVTKNSKLTHKAIIYMQKVDRNWKDQMFSKIRKVVKSNSIMQTLLSYKKILIKIYKKATTTWWNLPYALPFSGRFHLIYVGFL